jgi:hypothetical protein
MRAWVRIRTLAGRVASVAWEASPDFRDLHVYGGGALLAGGAWMAWPPGGLIAMGALLLYLGLRRM